VPSEMQPACSHEHKKAYAQTQMREEVVGKRRGVKEPPQWRGRQAADRRGVAQRVLREDGARPGQQRQWQQKREKARQLVLASSGRRREDRAW